MKKVLIVTGIFAPEIGGPASYAMSLAKELSQHTQVTVVAYSSVFSSASDKTLPFKVKRVWRKNFWFLRHALFGLKTFFAAGKHDVVYSLSMMNGGIVALLTARLRGKKMYLKVVGDYAWQVAVEKGRTSFLLDDFQKSSKSGWIKFLYWLQGWLARKADGVVVPSEYLSGVVQGWGVHAVKIHMIYNGTDFVSSDLPKEEARKQVGIPGNIILSVGRLVPWKGFRMLIKIMPQLLEINQFFRLVIVGDGPEMQVLKSMIKNLNLDRKVILIGRKTSEELAIFLAAADMMVLNTGYEGFSHQILEAMAAQVPVITTAVGGNREIIRQGENGFMVKYNDEFNLIEAIKTVSREADIREQFVKEGLQTIKQFSAQRMFQETITFLNQ